jgi:hypothetical protein
MTPDAFERLIADARAQTLRDLRAVLLGASTSVLRKLAVDLVPALFRAGYDGELAATGDHWADAWARPRAAGLPTFLVRVHKGSFGEADASHLHAAMHGGHVVQSALVIISEKPLQAGVRTALGSAVPWIVDTDGLVNLMLNANLGIATRVYESKAVDPRYFQ